MDDDIHIQEIFTPEKKSFEKFDTCKYRSDSLMQKSLSCCSSKKIEGFVCTKKNIFPLSYTRDCSICTEYSPRAISSSAT